MAIPYLFLTGFLGAGKTTLLNGLLKAYGDKRIGVIVNDFGELGIDASLIRGEGLTGGIRELKAGQIFCSCLSGSFVKSVLAYEAVQPDLLIVECSGLAKPSSLKDIARAISLEAPGAFTYGGMICLIDAERHAVLEKTLMVLKEQMAASDLFLVSKTDLVSPESREALMASLAREYPGKHAVSVVRGQVEPGLLERLNESPGAYRQVESSDFAGWGEKGRPLTFRYSPPKGSFEEIRRRLNPFLSRLYRIKGVVETSDRGRRLVDGTNAGLELREAPPEVAPGLTVITHDPRLEEDMNKD